MNQKLTATIKLTRAQYVFLRDRYKRRDGISADKLVQFAMLEIVSMQAQQELSEAETQVEETGK